MTALRVDPPESAALGTNSDDRGDAGEPTCVASALDRQGRTVVAPLVA